MQLGAAPRADLGLLPALLDAVPAGLAVLGGPEARIRLANAAFRALAAGGADPGGLAAEELWPDEDGLRLRALVERAARREPSPAERVERGAGAARRCLVVHASPLGGGPDVLVTLWDATAHERALAGERARLQEALRAQVGVAERDRARAEALAGVAAELNRGADSTSVLGTAIDRSVELLGGDDGSVYLLVDGGTRLRGVAERRPLGRIGLELRVADLPHTSEALARRAAMHYGPGDAEGLERAWCEQHGLESVTVLPMLGGARPYGVLFVTSRRGAPPLAPEDLAFGEAVAAHCALALGRAQIYEDERAARARAEAAEAVTRRTAHRLALSQELTAALSSAHGQEDVARAIFASGLGALDARGGALLVRHGDDALRVLRGEGSSAEAFGHGREPIPLDLPAPATEAFREGQGVFVRDEADLARRWPHLVEAARERGELARAAVPLVVEGARIGVLDVSFAGAREFDLEERAFFAWIGNKCAQALERARLHDAERAAREEAERASRLQEQLLAVVGHDLRTPLSAITMGASVLFRRGGLDEKQAQTLGRIAAAAQRMTGIIRDLLDFSRVRQGTGIPVERAPLDLAEVASKAILELQAVHPLREIALQASGDASLLGDEARLLQVVSNLVGNAVQHGLAGTRVEVRVQGLAGEVALEVRNAGAPIPPDLLPVLFEPFKRGERRASGEAGSVGLGLFIVREIVRAHGGDVTVRSGEAEGTAFHVRLPRAAAPAAG